jgi:hypothetical protein
MNAGDDPEARHRHVGQAPDALSGFRPMTVAPEAAMIAHF